MESDVLGSSGRKMGADPLDVKRNDLLAIILGFVMQFVEKLWPSLELLVIDLALFKEFLGGLVRSQTIRGTMANQQRDRLCDFLVPIGEQLFSIGQHVVHALSGTVPMDQRIRIVFGHLFLVPGHVVRREFDGDLEGGEDLGDDTSKTDGELAGTRGGRGQDQRGRGNQS